MRTEAETLYDCSFLSFLRPIPHIIPEKAKRKVFHGDYDSVPKRPFEVGRVARASFGYDRNKPLILEALAKAGKALDPFELRDITDLEINSVRRALRQLHDKNLIVLARPQTRGKNREAALWKLKPKA